MCFFSISKIIWRKWFMYIHKYICTYKHMYKKYICTISRCEVRSPQWGQKILVWWLVHKVCAMSSERCQDETCFFAKNDPFFPSKTIVNLALKDFFVFFLKVNLIGKDTTTEIFRVKFFKVSGWRKKIPGSETDSGWAYRCQWWLSGKLNDLAGGSSWMFFLKTSGDGKLFEAKN